MNIMKRSIFLIMIFLLFLVSEGQTAIVFQDDFDSVTQTYCTEGVPTGWGHWSSCDETDAREVDGVTHYPTEFVTGAACRGGSGGCYANWRNGATWMPPGEPDGYWETLSYDGLASTTYKDLYIGFSLKLPTDMDVADTVNLKWSFPPNIDSGDTSGTTYTNFYGSTTGCANTSFKTAPWVYGSSAGAPYNWVFRLFCPPVHDGAWHFYLYRIKLNSSNGVADGKVQSWIDGVQQTVTSDLHDPEAVDLGANIDTYFTGGENRASIGFGNVGSGSPVWQDGWRALLIDDFVISTTYVDPPSTSDITAPSVSISTSDPSAIITDALTVTGTASDAVGVTECKYRIGAAPDGSNGMACTGTTSWSCSTSGYSVGANTLYVGCTDAAANWGAGDSITVNYTLYPSVTLGSGPAATLGSGPGVTLQ